MKKSLLGGLTPREFLRRHWQKRPLYVRGALPRFTGVLDARQLFTLARRDDVESRIVTRKGRRWDTTHGPFAAVSAQKRDWTILVSGVNLHHAKADALLRRFSFIPQARLDDVMVSYATPGGGVGPHVDSYDVFLLQGAGRRRWTVTGGGSRAVYTAHPGDLLYLPPGWRHDGVALEPCFTCSIGFRAPRGAELGTAFLDWLHERGLPDARYRDPRLAPAREPARIPAGMIAFAAAALERIRWTRGDVASFLGEYLSTPKPHVVFRPRRARRLGGGMVRLDPKTQLLYDGRRFFINGEAFTLSAGAAHRLRALADERVAEVSELARAGLGRLISEWQRHGYLSLEKR
ncbi:MAG TPA: cupin domain-containing protein [Burkholderiales bacterium]|nr:cupin domain-containing protein [Burkholderiales bacterium]